MNEKKFSCCSSYMVCSEKWQCIKPEQIHECNYWNNNLSQGRNFYSSNPRPNKYKDLYIVVGGRAFKVYKGNKNGYSYQMNNEEINSLEKRFTLDDVVCSFNKDKLKLDIHGTPENPAYYRVNINVEGFIYNIKNYNGYEITEDEARTLVDILPKQYSPQVIRWHSGGYIKINLPKSADKEPKTKILNEKNEEEHQISIFEMLTAISGRNIS